MSHNDNDSFRRYSGPNRQWADEFLGPDTHQTTHRSGGGGSPGPRSRDYNPHYRTLGELKKDVQYFYDHMKEAERQVRIAEKKSDDLDVELERSISSNRVYVAELKILRENLSKEIVESSGRRVSRRLGELQPIEYSTRWAPNADEQSRLGLSPPASPPSASEHDDDDDEDGDYDVDIDYDDDESIRTAVYQERPVAPHSSVRENRHHHHTPGLSEYKPQVTNDQLRQQVKDSRPPKRRRSPSPNRRGGVHNPSNPPNNLSGSIHAPHHREEENNHMLHNLAINERSNHPYTNASGSSSAPNNRGRGAPRGGRNRGNTRSARGRGQPRQDQGHYADPNLQVVATRTTSTPVTNNPRQSQPFVSNYAPPTTFPGPTQDHGPNAEVMRFGGERITMATIALVEDRASRGEIHAQDALFWISTTYQQALARKLPLNQIQQIVRAIFEQRPKPVWLSNGITRRNGGVIPDSSGLAHPRGSDPYFYWMDYALVNPLILNYNDGLVCTEDGRLLISTWRTWRLLHPLRPCAVLGPDKLSLSGYRSTFARVCATIAATPNEYARIIHENAYLIHTEYAPTAFIGDQTNPYFSMKNLEAHEVVRHLKFCGITIAQMNDAFFWGRTFLGRRAVTDPHGGWGDILRGTYRPGVPDPVSIDETLLYWPSSASQEHPNAIHGDGMVIDNVVEGRAPSTITTTTPSSTSSIITVEVPVSLTAVPVSTGSTSTPAITVADSAEVPVSTGSDDASLAGIAVDSSIVDTDDAMGDAASK